MASAWEIANSQSVAVEWLAEGMGAALHLAQWHFILIAV